MSSEIVLVAFYLFMLVYSVILHEVAHGVVAYWLGDLTAKYAGRITLSPWSHVDPLGSFIIPVVLFVTTGFAFGYAKPVPYNPYNLRDQKWGPLYVALAGPATNFILAFIGAFLASILPLSLLAKQDILGRFLGIISGRGEFFERFELLAMAMTGSTIVTVEPGTDVLWGCNAFTGTATVQVPFTWTLRKLNGVRTPDGDPVILSRPSRDALAPR